MAADLTPEQYEMLFGEQPPSPDSTTQLTYADPVNVRQPRLSDWVVRFIREHPVDSIVIALLVVGAFVGMILR